MLDTYEFDKMFGVSKTLESTPSPSIYRDFSGLNGISTLDDLGADHGQRSTHRIDLNNIEEYELETIVSSSILRMKKQISVGNTSK